MRLPAARSVAALTLALGTIGCGRPEPPAVSVRTPSVDADDIAVMRGVLDVLRRPHFLVVDTTLAPCPVHPPRTSLAFGERNRERLPLTGSLGADTTLISATVVDFLPSEDLVARYPQGTAVVTFSAPLYPPLALRSSPMDCTRRTASQLSRGSSVEPMAGGRREIDRLVA